MVKPGKHGGVQGRQNFVANSFNKVSKKFEENGKAKKFDNNGKVKKFDDNGKVKKFEQNGTSEQQHKKPFNGQKKEKFRVQPLVKHKEDMKWFEYQINEKSADPEKDTFKGEKGKTIFDEADILMRTDFDRHSQSARAQGGSEASWLLNVVKKGTSSDRMTAMQLQIHNSPVHSLPYVETMVASMEKKSTREAMEVIPILEEVFLNHYLPGDRKLLAFSSRPLAKLNQLSSNSQDGRARILVLWMFEHKLKLVYERFLKALESVASGVVEDLAKRALKCSLNLLADRPEAEQFLLTMLVNKLGHPNRHVGAYVANLLEELTRRQPTMRPIIIKEVERLVYRKNVSERAHLYAATFLSQVALKAGEDTLATQMLAIYFGLFKTVVSHKKQNTKLLPILLAAANRAFPYAKTKSEVLEEDINALYKVVNTGSFPVALQTLKFLYQVHSLSDSLSDRFYSSLYRKLEDTIPHGSFNQLMLLLFKALKHDSSDNRVRAFAKRLLQLATGAPPPLAAGILILVSRLWEEKPSVVVLKRGVDKVAKAAVLLGGDDEDEHFVDVGLDGKPIVKTEIKKDEDDVKNEIVSDDEDNNEEEKKPLAGTLSSIAKDGWVHKAPRTARNPYDPAARNPLFIDCSQLVDAELLLLAKHYHPSVAVFAQQMLEGKTLNYRGDPLEDFTLMTFLDRFAYRNPKDKNKKVQEKTTKVIKKKAYDPWGVKKLAVTSKEYLEKKESELPPDERYLHRFAQLKFKVKEEDGKEKDDEWEYSSVNSEEFDELIDKFEPGEGNDEFDVDFSQEFSSEKQKKRGDKRQVESDGEDDELSDMGDDDDDEDDDEGGEDDEDDDDVEDDDDDGFEEDDEEERAFSRGGKAGKGFEESDDDEEFGDQDVEMAADRFGAMLEDMDEEDTHREKDSKKHKTRKPKGFKKRR